ncbi:Lrp/AsnC family transcriptional regulator [Aminomonas paucivorans]|uniref:Transcriptional regulator, AsnC family n=1 Tax=Aminomonas paucivorans DSM 12260 TaxID=584708 RepID=E3CXA0_9BACT|nr:Lrp/AsnC family transcriptional regulator [Aminomonas paucivorans]EFQ22616.1 transcriptional regulator, AsnC family [Aminomonas paucivorans DSM 12260]
MDALDRKLLEDLTSEGRISYAELGRKYGLTRVSIKERIDKLRGEGIIENFTITISPEATGKHVSAFFEIDVEPFHLDNIARTLAQEDTVENLYLMTGSSTLHMHALLRDMEDLERFVLERIYSLKGITRVQTHMILKRYKSRKGGLRL